MAFFKFRWPGQREQQAEKPAKRSRSSQADSIDAMRRRARHRLIGAAVLVLAGVIGFPLLFDTQPRPIPVDIPIEIPDRNKVAPLVVPAEAPAQRSAPPKAPSGPGGITDGEELLPSLPIPPPLPKPAASKPVVPLPVPVPPLPKPEPKPEPKPAPKVESKPEVKPEAKAPAASAVEPRTVKNDDAARARALLEGRPVETAADADDNRFIVQVGAFADADKAREVRSKLERAGLKTYTQVVDTKDGKRTRVRVGPFANRAEADKAAARIKSLDLSASVLSL